eukprot:CAMPEP_0196769406 /NCGR_PEP_ID=MMETSP1104-20130614/520_1 /TAXON_ID=33652 /ORGANISM="Cafeteria sp., Strain Caron Lab Isolate" /LENGTH=408 /DNA_ID=CAMNT_0042139501 /DNA_START=42 /DNA_END=1268 /DNA_ORIENTATION=-
MSRFESVPLAPPNAIFGLTQKYKEDTAARKVNLGIGAYRTDEGAPYYFEAVREAEKRILADASVNKEYLPIAGLPEFRALAVRMLLGESSVAIAEGRAASVQGLSGTGSLRILFEFVSRHMKPPAVYVPSPTWPNHNKLIADCGLESSIRTYTYYNPDTRGLNFEGMMASLAEAPEGSVVVLHACAHNPTGVDPTIDQWRQVADLCKARSLFPFFDCAYQGFASGDLDADAAAVRLFEAEGLEFFCAQSFAKNMGLYCERIGAATIVAGSADALKRILSQMEIIIRPMYSNPPAHGARIVAQVLGDASLYAQWRAELGGLTGRIHKMREALFEALKSLGTPGDWTHIVKHRGMFTFTGLRPEHVELIQHKYHIYMLSDGRINVAGLGSSDVDYVAEAIHDAVTSISKM